MERIEQRGLTGSALKWVAIVTMLIDHAGLTLVYGAAKFHHAWGTGLMSLKGYYFLRGVGRLSFPLFCFLLVEGFFHTRSRGKYLLRLGLFALLSELPFDLALKGTWQVFGNPELPFWTRIGLEFSSQNVFFTLFLGLLAVWIWDSLTLGNRPDCGGLRGLYAMICVIGLGAAAYYLKTDYRAMGVALILALYLLHDRPWERDLAAFGALGGMIAFGSMWIEIFAGLSFPLMHAYNGQRGRQSKYLFYLIYPGHLLALAILQKLLFGG